MSHTVKTGGKVGAILDVPTKRIRRELYESSTPKNIPLISSRVFLKKPRKGFFLLIKFGRLNKNPYLCIVKLNNHLNNIKLWKQLHSQSKKYGWQQDLQNKKPKRLTTERQNTKRITTTKSFKPKDFFISQLWFFNFLFYTFKVR